MSRRVLLNCWLVAMWIWLAGHCRQYIWTRRSHSFKGKILHFGAANAAFWKTVKVIEYIPPKRHLWTRRNKLLLFEGTYRVWHLRVHTVRRHRSRQSALEDFQQ